MRGSLQRPKRVQFRIFWGWKIWFTCLIREVFSWNNPDVFCSHVAPPTPFFFFFFFPDWILRSIFRPLSCLHILSLFSILLPFYCCCHCCSSCCCCSCCCLELKCFSNFTHTLTANTLLPMEEWNQEAGGTPWWLIAEIQLRSPPKHLASTSLKNWSSRRNTGLFWIQRDL